jgi:ribosome-associated protein
LSGRPRRRSPAHAATLLGAAARTAADKKARDIVALDLREVSAVADYFLICSGSSERQVEAIAEAVEEALAAQGWSPWHVEGRGSHHWVLLDYVDLVVHVFHERTREYYLLERLWGDARRVELDLGPTD